MVWSNRPTYWDASSSVRTRRIPSLCEQGPSIQLYSSKCTDLYRHKPIIHPTMRTLCKANEQKHPLLARIDLLVHTKSVLQDKWISLGLFFLTPLHFLGSDSPSFYRVQSNVQLLTNHSGLYTTSNINSDEHNTRTDRKTRKCTVKQNGWVRRQGRKQKGSWNHKFYKSLLDAKTTLQTPIAPLDLVDEKSVCKTLSHDSDPWKPISPLHLHINWFIPGTDS